jgi:hypothetical protein
MPQIKGYLCFFNEQVDEIRVDGVPVARPVPTWCKDWKKAATVPGQPRTGNAAFVTATTPTWARLLRCASQTDQVTE